MIPRYTFALLLALIPLVAVPFAGNRMWAWGLLAALVGAMMLAMALAGAANPANLPLAWPRYRFLGISYMVLLAWMLIQASALTPGFLHHPLWAETAALLGRPVAGAISLDPAASLGEAAKFLAYGGIFWLTLQFAGRDRRARLILWVVLVAGAANAAYGLVVYFSGADTILWYAKWAYPGTVSGTFVNRNHFATYAGIAMIVGFAFLIEELRRISAGISLRTVEGLLRVSEAMSLKFFVLIVLLAALGMAMVLTGSRAALMAAGLGVAAFLWGITLSARISGDRVLRFGLAMAVLGLIGASVSGGLLAERIGGTTRNLGDRLGVYEAVIEVIAGRPLLGTGGGTFRDVFLTNRPQGLGAGLATYDYAHNTYLEFALENGLPALVLALLMAAYALKVFIRGERVRRRNDMIPAVGIGATVLVAAHALVDFSLEIPAVAVVYAMVAAVAYAQSFSNAERGAAAPSPPTGQDLED